MVFMVMFYAKLFDPLFIIPLLISCVIVRKKRLNGLNLGTAFLIILAIGFFASLFAEILLYKTQYTRTQYDTFSSIFIGFIISIILGIIFIPKNITMENP